MKIIFAILFVIKFNTLNANNERRKTDINESEEVFLEYEEGQRYFYFPDSNGILHLVDIEEKEMSTFDIHNDIEFVIYTRKNRNQPDVIRYNDSISLILTNYNKIKPTKMIAHGWLGNKDSEINVLVKDSFLEASDVNVICVNWGSVSTTLYSSAVSHVPSVGKMVGQFIDWLILEGSNIRQFHLMGHSLGAHVMAVAARTVTQGRVPILTGFDPANPLWSSNPAKMTSNDAEYVEVIHTNAGSLGFKHPLGHNDFYPNGGRRQPGCHFYQIGCSHARSYIYFAESLIYNKFEAMRCRNYSDIEDDELCTSGPLLRMGGQQSKPKLGVFYLKTSYKKPYHMS